MTVNLVTGSSSANTLVGSNGDDLIYGFDPDAASAQMQGLTATRIVDGLSQPLFAGAPPHDPDRLFVVEKGGVIKIVDLANGGATTVALDVGSQITTVGEQGLLGLAFHPDFAANGKLYVQMTNTAGDTEVREFTMSADDPSVIDPDSGRLIIRVDLPADRTNHRTGWLGFGPDGMLYLPVGDGGNTPASAIAQDPSSLLGKILRIDVNGDDFPGDPDRNYAIPADNPFIASPALDEIWALGVRNPFRDSFDRVTGDFYIADVGGALAEEINLGASGANYGWSLFEGAGPRVEGSNPDPTGFTFPIHSYGRDVGRSITGGYAYRGQDEALQGHYVFADFVLGKIFTLVRQGGDWVATERTADIVYDFGSVTLPSSFGEDGRGNLYVVDFEGEIYRLSPQTTATDGGDTLNGRGGDDWIYGGSGNDTLLGSAGVDVLYGMNGNDVLAGGVGADVIDGGDGLDMASYASAQSGVVVNLNDVALNAGDAAGDRFTSIERVRGSAHDDMLTGDDGANVIVGADGDDALDGGLGVDVLNGGAGADTFIFSVAPSVVDYDRVIDFSTAIDRIAISASAFGGGLLEGGDAVLVAGATPASSGPGAQFLYDTDGAGSGRLSFDADGQGGARPTLVALLVNTPTLAASDIIILA